MHSSTLSSLGAALTPLKDDDSHMSLSALRIGTTFAGSRIWAFRMLVTTTSNQAGRALALVLIVASIRFDACHRGSHIEVD